MTANAALVVLETALRERKLDRTLTTALPPLERSDSAACIPFDITALDTVLRGGLPRGQVSELAGPHSSGRTTLLLHLLGAATRRGEIAALIDTCDRLDVASASAAGIDLDRLLWIRGDSSPFDSLRSLRARANSDRVIDRALKALNLVLQAGGFGVVAIDLADVPPRVLKTLPFTTWLRLQRIVEGSDTACLLVGPEPLARSAGGLTVMCTGRTTWSEATQKAQSEATQKAQSEATQKAQSEATQEARSEATQKTRSEATQEAGSKTLSGARAWRRFTGLDTEIRVVSPRRRVDGETRVAAVANDA